MACYLVFYLAFFKLLEQGIQVPDLVLHCRLDDLIPFCKYAIIPYYLWFAWIPCTLFYLLWFNDRREFWRLCLPLFTGMTLSLLFCAIVPNGTDLRPAYIYGNDIFTRTVRALWRTDTSTNVFPSIHVFNSVTLALAYHHCARLRGRKWLWVRVSADLLCVSIILSTMLLKQHSVIDVMGGIILALTLDAGHFHPTEVISDKIPTVLLFVDELLLHVSRPVRWDSDHVVIMDDELAAIAQSLIRNDLLARTNIGLDFFDASINRTAAWIIGTRNTIKALLRALLEPTEALMKLELAGDYTSRLAMLEELKSYPFAAVWDYYCEAMGVPVREAWLSEIKNYEREVQFKRG